MTSKGAPRQESGLKVMIASMPWADPGVPSIQLGILKRFLSDRHIPIVACHWYLNIALGLGVVANAAVSQPRSSDAERLYSYLLFPEMRNILLRSPEVAGWVKRIEKAIKKSQDRPKLRFRWDDGFFQEFEALNQSLLDRYNWEEFALVGFTLNYAQNVASLYMAREIKKRNPRCKIIIGGGEATEGPGASLLENFPQLDYACNGEGEIPFYHLAKAILEGASEGEIRNIRGLMSRNEDGTVRVNPPHQVESMDELETPDYDDYFEEFERHDLDPHTVFSELPIEASRGCPFSCSFCNLNRQWENFRCRSPEKVCADLKNLTQKYDVLAFRFMDNILPKDSELLFKKMAEHNVDYRFFCEIRAQTAPRVLRLMKKAGANLIQCGIEALSTSVLKKTNKKSRFINNLQEMKLCEELGIRSDSCIVMDFPSCTEEDVEETIRNVEYCLAYQPTRILGYILFIGSPDYDQRRERGVLAIRNADEFRLIYPPEIYDKLDLITKTFRAPKQKVKWGGAVQAVKRWKTLYTQGKQKLINRRRTLLGYFDGRTFLEIEDYRGRTNGGFTLFHLDEFQREVYLFADEITHWNAFRERFGSDEPRLKELLRYFIDHKLMYEEDGQYLSLAMSEDLSRAMSAVGERELAKAEGILPLPSGLAMEPTECGIA